VASHLQIDFETCSQVDLKTAGVYRYAMHKSTEILMMYWAFDDEEPVGWFPGDKWPDRITLHIRNDGRINAANAAFERLIWWYVMPKYQKNYPVPLPTPELEQFYCTLYKARCNNMPASLDKLARALGTFNQKTAAEGKKLIKWFCILDEHGNDLAEVQYRDDENTQAGLFDGFCDYCAQDVRAERDAGKMLREPTEDEWEDYFVSERINDRGVRIDYALAKAATQYAQEETRDLTWEIQELTNFEVEKPRGEKIKKWIMDQLGTDDEMEPMIRYKANVKKYSLDKYAREHLLDDHDLDDRVRQVIECVDDVQKSSVAKFKAMTLRADPQTDRVCGAFMANGAAGTGRFSSKGLQVHNFPRGGMGEHQGDVIKDLSEGIMSKDMTDYYEMPIMTILSKMLRAAIVPAKGKVLLAADWSSIEGRVAPWLTCTRGGEKKLEQYRVDFPFYETNAAEALRIDIDDVDGDQRQVGKVMELAFQFGGGSNAFLAMARGYGVNASKAKAEEFKDSWRENNSWAVNMWQRCESAAFTAISSPGTQFVTGKVVYFAVPKIMGFDMTLFCQLPCGRVLTYPDVRVGQKETPWGEMRPALSAMRSGWTPKAGDKKWPRGGLYGGLLFENIVQGTAASLLREALADCDGRGLPVVLHVHDEIVLEVPNDSVGYHMDQLDRAMNDVPDWAQGIPLKAEINELERYGK